MKRRLLSLVLLLLLCALLPCAQASGALEFGDFQVSGNLSGCAYESGVLRIQAGGAYTISMKSGAAQTADRILICSDEPVTLTLCSVHIDTQAGSPIALSGSAAVTFTLQGETTLQAADAYSGLYLPGTASLIVQGDGQLTTAGATGIGGSRAAGASPSCGSLTVAGGIISATGRYGAGIGGASSTDTTSAGAGGTVTITGGTVEACSTGGTVNNRDNAVSNTESGRAVGGGYDNTNKNYLSDGTIHTIPHNGERTYGMCRSDRSSRPKEDMPAFRTDYYCKVEYESEQTSSYLFIRMEPSDLAITGPEDGWSYAGERYDLATLTIRKGGNYTISMREGRTATNDGILVDVGAGTPVTITIDSLVHKISSWYEEALRLKSGTVTLKLKGENTFESGTSHGEINFLDTESTELIITSADGDGKTSGTLNVSSQCRTAAIGSAEGYARLTIRGGTIRAYYSGVDRGTAIGGPDGIDLTVTGGILHATAISGGAAIGSSWQSSGKDGGSSGKVTVTGGEVYATSLGSGGAAIGSGPVWAQSAKDGAEVLVTGGKVVAITDKLEYEHSGTVYSYNNYSAAIGGGQSFRDQVTPGGSGTLTITGGTVIAIAKSGGRAIGSGVPLAASASHADKTVLADAAANRQITVLTADTPDGALAAAEGSPFTARTDLTQLATTCASFRAETATYALSASPKAAAFDTAVYGYETPAAITITLTNTGSEPLTGISAALTGNSFTLGTLSAAGLQPGEAATIAVQPLADLPAGDYTDTLTISAGSEASALQIPVSFRVAKKQAEGPASPSPDPVVYSPVKTLGDLPLPDGWLWQDADSPMPLPGTHNCLVRWAIADDTNFDWSRVPGYNAAAHCIVRSIALTVLPAAQAAPDAPVLQSRTTTSITLREIPANANGAQAEYSIDGGSSWQQSPVFQNLKPQTSYCFVARYAATGAYAASPASAETVISTASSARTIYYTLTFQTNGGSSLEALTRPNGSVIDLFAYVPRREGCSFAGWYKDAALQQRITSVTLTGDLTIYAAWLADGNPFADVRESDWFCADVLYAYRRGLLTGVDASHFCPNAPMTRAMLLTVLARLDGVLSGSGADWYVPARTWAMENGISDGSAMDAPVTREQLAAILFRYAIHHGMLTVTLEENLSAFTDAGAISSYAVPAMNWAVGRGLLMGSGDQLDPAGTATRAQTAAILQRYLNQ